VCDARYHSAAADGSDGESNYQVRFATNERREAIAAAKDSGGGACVVQVDDEAVGRIWSAAQRVLAFKIFRKHVSRLSDVRRFFAFLQSNTTKISPSV